MGQWGRQAATGDTRWLQIRIEIMHTHTHTHTYAYSLPVSIASLNSK